MGYTHYFNTRGKDLNQKKFDLFIDQSKRIVNIAMHQGIELTKRYGEDDSKPHLGPYALLLNGKGDQGHEDFVIERQCADYCKTIRKPYDAVVTAVLIAFKVIFKGAVEVTTDGDDDDWIDGAELYKDALGMTPKMTIVVRDGIGTLTLK